MRKAKLSLDTLQVETFEPDAAAVSPRGTVHANAITQFTSYCQCDATHYGTCQGTCVDTCGGPTCDLPCHSAMTCYLTCRAGCAWTDGWAVCNEIQTRDC